MLVGFQLCAVQVEVNQHSLTADYVRPLAITDLRKAVMRPVCRHYQPQGIAGNKV